MNDDRAEALPAFNDPRVQVAYEILCSDNEAPDGEHWEGFAARRIVAALEPAHLTDERIDYIADLVVKGMPEGISGFLKSWGWRQFARAILADCAGHIAEPAAPAAQSAAKSLLDRMVDGYCAEVEAEHAIAEILGAELIGIGFDEYDDSFEIYPESAVPDVAPTPEQHAAILALGCQRYWINFPDDTERYGLGERKPANSKGRWERFDRSEQVKRATEAALAAHQPSQSDEAREALRELVAINDLKRSLAQANHHAARFPTDENYAVIDSLSTDIGRRQPLAWERARAALASQKEA